jgi:hypothetical protein
MALPGSLVALGLDVRGDSRAWAAFSACARYRYALGRSWTASSDAAAMLFVLHNPSTADHETDDPTLRRCLGYARRQGMGRLVVVNVFAYRSTDKRTLLSVDDPFGSINDSVLQLMRDGATCIVVAWGRVDQSLRPRVQRARRSLFAPSRRKSVVCLGRNRDGSVPLAKLINARGRAR